MEFLFCSFVSGYSCIAPQVSKYNRQPGSDFRVLRIPHFVPLRYWSHRRAQRHVQILDVTGCTSPPTLSRMQMPCSNRGSLTEKKPHVRSVTGKHKTKPYETRNQLNSILFVFEFFENHATIINLKGNQNEIFLFVYYTGIATQKSSKRITHQSFI